MTDNTQPEALRLADTLDLAPENGIEPQTAEDAAAELRRQHARIAELEARIKTMAEEHADELMVAHLDGRMRAAQQPAPSAAAHKACKPDMLVNGGALKLALNVLRRAGKHEVADELEATAQPTPTPQADSVLEDATHALRASHGQAPAGLAVPSMSADEVNALPTAARAYIHQLATNTDPAGMVRENMQLRDTNAGLQSMYRKAADAAQEVVGCFHAAECEGLQAALAGTADEHLKDLVERRLMHALYAAQEVAGQAPAQAAPAAVAGPHVTDAMALAFHSALSDGALGSDEVEEIKAGLRAALAAAFVQPAPPQEPSHTAVQLAELVLSDCGHSSNYTPLLDRVAARIDSHTERRLDELRRCLESKPAPQQEPIKKGGEA